LNNAYDEVRTALTEPIKKGATVLQFAGFDEDAQEEIDGNVIVGTRVVIDAGTAMEEDNEVKAFGSIILMRPLKFDHGAGASVTFQPSSAGSGRRRRSSSNDDNGNNNNFDFNNGNDLEEPEDHLKGLEDMIKDAISKEMKPLLQEVKAVEEKAKEIGENHGDIDLDEAVKPLVDKAEDIEDEVKKAAKARSAIDSKVEEVGEDIEAAHKSISSAAKGAATSDDVSDTEDEIEKHMTSMKKHAVTGINKVGKVAVKNQKYLKAIYKSIHH